MILSLFHREVSFGFRCWLQVVICIFLCLIITAYGAFAETRILIKPILLVTEEITDNLFLTEEGERYDFITFVAPGISAQARNRTMDINFLYQLGYSSYSRFSENNSWRHLSQLTGQIAFSRHTLLEFSNNFRITEEPTVDLRDRLLELDEEEQDLEEDRVTEQEVVRRVRDRQLSNTAHVGLAHQLNPYSTITMNYDYSVDNSEDPTVRNRTRHTPSLELEYWFVPERMGLEAELVYSRDNTDDSLDEFGYQEERIGSAVTLNYWPLPKRLGLKGGLAYELGVTNEEEDALDPMRSPDNWFESLSPLVGFTYLLPSIKAGIETEFYYKKAITYDDDNDLTDPTDDFNTWFGSAEIYRQFNRQWKGIFGFRYSRTDFQGPDVFDPDGEDFEEDYTVYEPSAGVEYLMMDELPLALRVGYLIREKEFSGTESAITVNGRLGAWQFVRNGSLKFNVASGYDESLLDAERLGFGFYYNADLAIDYIFSKNLKGDVYGFYERNRFIDFEDTRNDRVIEVGTGLSYTPLRWLLLNFSYRHREVDSTEENDSYRENRIMMKAVLSPYRPFQLY